MIADWVAVTVRGRGLASRRLGEAGARRLAGMPSLDAGIAVLARSAYGRDVRAGMSVRAAQHAVSETLLWHLRILAGWARPDGADCVRQLGAGFEIANVVGQLARIEGRPADPAYALGALTLGWSQIAPARTAAGVRHALAASSWGDPGGTDPGSVRAALLTAWCRRVADAVPDARPWAAAFAALLVARGVAAGAPLAGDAVPQRHVDAVLGSRWQAATTLDALAAELPRAAAWVLAGVRSGEDVWKAETRWWTRVEADALRLCARPQPESAIVVGLVALLAADAWRTRGALELAARGGAQAADGYDASA
jgi:hypothetical protein